jgi:hypothetical protein
MSVPPSPPPLSETQPQASAQFPFQRPEPGAEPRAAPSVPAPRATPERLVQLLINIANRLERLEGIASRLDDDMSRLERRYDGLEARVVGLAEHTSLLAMLVGRLPSLEQLGLCMLGVAAGTVALVVAGVLIAHRYWNG